MNREFNTFTQLFLIAGFWIYLYPAPKYSFLELNRMEFVADWFLYPFDITLHNYDYKYRFNMLYFNPLKCNSAQRLRANN